jgi:glycerol-3-phosphate dehydrogenase (NAD(P)+)
MRVDRIAVIGDGGWGTTLALLAARQGPVTVWGPDADYLRFMNQNRMNPKFLPEIHLPDQIHFDPDLSKVLHNHSVILYVVPSQFTPAMLNQLRSAAVDWQQKMFVLATKGLDYDNGCVLTETFQRQLSLGSLAVISGPTIAPEVARGIPSAAVVASMDQAIAAQVQNIVAADSFRLYTNDDLIGVQLGGALKNVIALACGICDGLGYGTNTKSALLTRGLAEMSRLGQKMGAEPLTFMGLSGMGDLATTCFSPQSRNRTVGQRIGAGERCSDIINSMSMVAEGVETVRAVCRFAQNYDVVMPISEEVYRIIYEDKPPQAAVTSLLNRELTRE